MNPLNLVLDTNVLVAALKSNRGASFQLLKQLTEDKFVPNISVPLFVEYQDVLKRPELLPHLDAQDIDAVLDFILLKSRVREIFYLWRPILKDPKDDLVLEVAVESNSQFIVTFNHRDFVGVEKFGITILSPQELLLKLRENLS